MKQSSIIDRPNISDTLVATLRQMIVDGELAAGKRLNEVHLAAQLGISRTPLREALMLLVGEGAVYSEPRRGFFICPLSIAEFEQIYPLRALLDPEALRLAGVPSEQRLAKLEALNEKLRSAKSPDRLAGLDNAWHLELVADCPNRVLVELIEHFMRRTGRYELALLRERKSIQRAAQDHEKILKALRSGDLKAACAALKHNMESGKAPILDWLQARATK